MVTLDRCRVCIECSPLNRHIAERGRAEALPLSRSCDRAANPSYLSLPCSTASLPWLIGIEKAGTSPAFSFLANRNCSTNCGLPALKSLGSEAVTNGPHSY